MKNFLLAFSIVSLFAACSGGSKKDLEAKTDMVPVNTAGYAVSNASTDIGISEQQEKYIAPARKRVSTGNTSKRSSTTVTKEKDYTPAAQQNPATVPETKAPETVPANSTGTSSTAGKTESASTGTTTDTEKPAKKKGWSDAAKGAVIGGAAGAIGGAIINGKNREWRCCRCCDRGCRRLCYRKKKR